MYRLLLEFFLSLFVYFSISISQTGGAGLKNKTVAARNQNCTRDGNGTKQYEPPGTVKAPLGDEEYNTNLLGESVNEMQQEKGADYKQFNKGKCPKSTTAPLEDIHIACHGSGTAEPIEILYTADSLVTPDVQCKKCNLFLTPDGQSVVVHCTDCFEIPVLATNTTGVTAKKMWRSHVARFIKRKTFTRHTSQAAHVKTSPENPSDISAFKLNEELYGFRVKDIQDVPEFSVKAVSLVHELTKAEYLHLFRNDGNNTFSINFRTTPKDDTGIPHILEHTVLCGSQLFPVRDPFFKMLHRSLATFINAMTASDFTMYPFSTQNFSDFQNLQRIYLDAVFRPNLNELDFMQEGWRLENVNLADKNSNLIIKGVVFNEMKGVFSANERILEQKLQNLILPDHTYGYVSGGDPLKIPDLTWDGLKTFHKKHYHPSNARFYSYGNFPLTPTLKYLNEEYLSKYSYEDTSHTVVPKQTRWADHKREHLVCHFENMRGPIEKQNFVTVSILMTDILNVYGTFVLQFLTELLVKGSNAPFYKSMIEPNFSGGFTQITGFDMQQRDSVFTIGLQDIDRGDFERFFTLFDETIGNVVKTGFDENHIESVLHHYELSIKHETSNFGLNLLYGVSPLWNHNGDLMSALKVNTLIDRVRQEIKMDKHYLQNIVQKYFVENKHKLLLTVSADPEYANKQATLEQELVSRKTSSLTDSDREQNHLKCLELQKQQSVKQDTNLLPTLQMDDISNDVEKITRIKVKMAQVPTQINVVPTNKITYFRGVLNTSELTPEQRMLLPLFCYVITKMGTNTLNFRDFDSLMSRKTSGLNIQTHIGNSLYQLHTHESGLLLYSYCLDKNVESMWELWVQIFQIAQLQDVGRFETLVKLYMGDLVQGVTGAGHFYAMLAASALVSGSAYQKELVSGLHHISYMKRLLQVSNFDGVLKEVVNIAKVVFDKKKLRCCLNVTQSSQAEILKGFHNFMKQLPSSNLSVPAESCYTTSNVWTPTDSVNCHHHVLNATVNYCSKAILTVPYSNPEHAQLRVLAKLLSNKYLHSEIREKNGAYGGGAKLKTDGVFVFYSYRDPRHLETLDVFDKSYDWLNKHLSEMTPQDLLEAKLGVFQEVDAPLPPNRKGVNEFMVGLTPDVLQRHRADLMTVNVDALKNVADAYLGKKLPATNGKVVLGPKSTNFDTKSRTDELWTVVDS